MTSFSFFSFFFFFFAYIFHGRLFEAFLCFFDNSYLSFLYLQKKIYEKIFFLYTFYILGFDSLKISWNYLKYGIFYFLKILTFLLIHEDGK